MLRFETVRDMVKAYSRDFRHPNLPVFEISGLYDLFPLETTPHAVSAKWPDTWINSNRAGVYFVLDADLIVLYIGQALNFGYRFGEYFKGGKGPCKLNETHIWKGSPRFVETIAVPETSIFERLALEEYLISRIKPGDNIRGK